MADANPTTFEPAEAVEDKPVAKAPTKAKAKAKAAGPKLTSAGVPEVVTNSRGGTIRSR